MRYLSAEELLAIHGRVIAVTGGLKGIRDMNLLFSSVMRPHSAILGHEFYPTLFDKAGALLEALAVYHVFSDGNKRTALAATHYFLRNNGYKLMMTTESAHRFTLAVAQKKKTIKEIAGWLKKNSKRV